MTEDEKKQLRKKFFEETYRVEVEVLEGGKLPVKAHFTDAGFDLYASDDVVFRKGKVTKHPLNIRMKLPKSTYGHVKGKSGLGSRGLCLLAEIVDENYRGIPHVVATCLVDEPIHIKKGEKIAQMIIQPYSNFFYVEQVEAVDTDTDRGTGGFGSTGSK